MTPKDIQVVLRQLSTLVDGWCVEGSVAPIERDLALDKLRRLYDAVRLEELHVEAVESDVANHEDEALNVNLDDVFAASIVADDAVPEIAEGDINEQQSDLMTAIESSSVAPEVAAEIATPAMVEVVTGSLFDHDQTDNVRRRRNKQRMLMSLYGDEPRVEPKAEAIQSKEPAAVIAESELMPIAEPMVIEVEKSFVVEEVLDSDDDMVLEEIDIEADMELVCSESEDVAVDSVSEPILDKRALLGDVINHDVQTLADTFTVAHEQGTVRGEVVDDLRKWIGINDRFLIIRDLFEGDTDAFERAIATLNRFDDLDDCLIYIAEKYTWNPNSDGAKLLMELLGRKLS